MLLSFFRRYSRQSNLCRLRKIQRKKGLWMDPSKDKVQGKDGEKKEELFFTKDRLMSSSEAKLAIINRVEERRTFFRSSSFSSALSLVGFYPLLKLNLLPGFLWKLVDGPRLERPCSMTDRPTDRPAVGFWPPFSHSN